MIIDNNIRKLCVVIPAYNEEKVLSRAIESLFVAGIKPEDIFVADDCSKDKTAEIARSLGVKIKSSTTNLGKARTMEKMFALIGKEYDYVSILDADTTVDQNYFRFVIWRFATDDKIAAVCGQPRSARHNWLTAYRAYEYAFSLAIFKGGQDKMGVITVVPGCAATLKTSILNQIELHPEKIVSEDIEITTQIHLKQLGKVVYERNAIVHTQDPQTIKDYVRQIDRWYTSNWQCAKFYGLLFKFNRLSCEWTVLLAESLVFPFFVVATAVLAVAGLADYRWSVWAIGFDQLTVSLLAAFFAIKLARADIVLATPLFLIPRLINILVNIRTCWRVMVKRDKTDGRWLSPARY